ncbi:MAG TPA: maleylacetoacetate isomerase [Polyangia bacterium]|nr:maleylacetoacetate isomerase [Polyangia bacterium]
MKLYTYWRSTSAWRVRIALAWKGLAYEAVPVHLLEGGGRQHGDDFRALNASEQVPLLVLDEAGPDGRPGRLAQSMAILEYLEEAHPAPPLLPRGPFLRARARQLAQIAISGIQPHHNLATLQQVKAAGGDDAAWARHFLERGLASLERTAAETAGAFLVGDAVSFADVCLAPQLYAARRYAVELAPYPTLTRVDAACAALPAFQTAHADAQPDAPPRA